MVGLKLLDFGLFISNKTIKLYTPAATEQPGMPSDFTCRTTGGSGIGLVASLQLMECVPEACLCGSTAGLGPRATLGIE